ncbi:hypothetical protein VARIO8X_150013 [Burkholderiales bacterium 8X]|nr:hypothetical protein VARIO8X_150013 [Burkholderiales bacterium 8X]
MCAVQCKLKNPWHRYLQNVDWRFAAAATENAGAVPLKDMHASLSAFPVCLRRQYSTRSTNVRVIFGGPGFSGRIELCL